MHIAPNKRLQDVGPFWPQPSDNTRNSYPPWRSGNTKYTKKGKYSRIHSVLKSSQAQATSSFQAAILKNVNERNAHLQKQLDNLVREGVERDLEVERRKCRDLAESAREKDKEYQKLKAQYDALKRKTILAPDTLATAANQAAHQLTMNRAEPLAPQPQRLGDIAGGMDANRVQRTPLRQAQAQASTGFVQQPARMGPGGAQAFSLQRRATTNSATMRAFNLPQARPPGAASLSGSETDVGEEPGGYSRRPRAFQSVNASVFAKARNAPRVIAQPTPARTGPGGFRPAGSV
ncbi:E3 ubiquitin-protein ligase [Ceratobasidium theobromae]|uniref:E3 ubiquitin-protein ligase n=1 Tax=Ceratobasidium theobromae TaxID=1582974 RepID=A0A5N5QLC0_9AGAM|nr:E3 ubiquitin-protein ligase [Ceratobasidium theobromae]